MYETPGHAPSHVCLYQPERRLLISGDHVLGRISLFYDYGWTPDPVGEFLGSLDVVDELDARLALSGHGKPFVDVHGHIEGNRELVDERLEAVLGATRSEAQDGARDPARASTASPSTCATRPGSCPRRSPTCATSSARAASRAEPDGDVERWRPRKRLRS